MKKEFSTSWISSNQPRKQRKYLANAPLHIKHKFLSSNLSKELRKKHGKRNLPLRKGDDVLVMRGSSRKKKAKISEINLRKGFVYLEGIQRTKKDGAKVNVPFHPSSLQIQGLNLDDKKRIFLPQKKEETSQISEDKKTKKKESQENK
nr:50S ribosomal protein L24P [uncultured archaeon]